MSKKLSTGGVNVKDVAADKFIAAYAELLKRKSIQKDGFAVPTWTDTIKLGAFNELGPLDNDWFFTRIGWMPFLCFSALSSRVTHIEPHQPPSLAASTSRVPSALARSPRSTVAPSTAVSVSYHFPKFENVDNLHFKGPPHFVAAATGPNRAALKILQQLKVVEIAENG